MLLKKELYKARQCIKYKGAICSNLYCDNIYCPLNKIHIHEDEFYNSKTETELINQNKTGIKNGRVL